MFKINIFILTTVALTLSGCFAKLHTLPEFPTKENKSSVFQKLDDPSDTLVGIAVSGGGSRAATFAAGVLEELAKLQVIDDGKTKSLLETVTHMSSVSGGSLATAYYALNKPQRNVPVFDGSQFSEQYQKFFETFKGDMQKNFEAPAKLRQVLHFRALNPTKAAYTLSELWDDEFLKEKTFSDLYEREKIGDSPRIIFNGTIYNNGRRLAMTTLSPEEFNYDFVGQLENEFNLHFKGISEQGRKNFKANIAEATKQFMPLTFEDLKMNHSTLKISQTVATSSSFPPIIGPVSYQNDNETIHERKYHHVGDGGLFDNLGTESLTSVFLRKIPKDINSSKRGLIIVIDTSYPFNAGEKALDSNKEGFEVFKNDPSRIVGIMEGRANAYQTLLWHTLRSQDKILPDYKQLQIVILRHVNAEWKEGYSSLPNECKKPEIFSENAKPEEIRAKISVIPTRFTIKNECDAKLLFESAKQVVSTQREILDAFFKQKPHFSNKNTK